MTMINLHVLKKVLRLPPHVLGRRIWNRIKHKYVTGRARRQIRKDSTYLRESDVTVALLPRGDLQVSLEVLRANGNHLALACEQYVAHTFNLLGSGWVNVKHGMNCKGLEGRRYSSGDPVEADRFGNWLTSRVNAANVTEARATWSLIQGEYVPIDWHLDFKSGFRWREDTWYRDVEYGVHPGVDVKVPWELARMQHLPQIALYHLLLKRNSDDRASTIGLEFRNQVLDFIATNPPQWGVNWTCTMDVAIRAANWLVALDLFWSSGYRFDDRFLTALRRSIYQHGRHVVQNLEWNEQLRGNHYLANVAGLLMIASHLDQSDEVDDWLIFASHQLVLEVESQFHKDGSNFEASTCYHRLSAEMVAYATAALVSVPSQRQRRCANQIAKSNGIKSIEPVRAHSVDADSVLCLPEWFHNRLAGMADFTCQITDRRGHVPQIGDNDNGRFIKLVPEWPRGALTLPDDEDHLCHLSVVAALDGLLQQQVYRECAGPERLEREFIASYANQDFDAQSDVKLSEMSDNQKTAMDQPIASRDFGLYCLRNDNFSAWIRCGSIGQNGFGGHAHNDQLSFVFNVRGAPILIDPGTYLYTPFPDHRNKFRSPSSHNTLVVQRKQFETFEFSRDHLFRMQDVERITVREHGWDRFIGMRVVDATEHEREIRLCHDRLAGVDKCSSDLDKRVYFHFHPSIIVKKAQQHDRTLILTKGDTPIGTLEADADCLLVESGQCSYGYGSIVDTLRAELRFASRTCNWQIVLN